MEGYKRGRHPVWDCKYHVVWVTKYRYAVLGGDVGQRCRELIRETARAHEVSIHAGAINRDHVHLLLSIPPSLSVSPLIRDRTKPGVYMTSGLQRTIPLRYVLRCARQTHAQSAGA